MKLDQYGGWTDIKTKGTGFFRTEKIDGRWWLVDPDGNVFISLGMNHIESCALKHLDNMHIYKERYGTDDKWLKEGVGEDLRAWGFNSIGWTQEVVGRYASDDPLRHRITFPGWEYESTLIHGGRVWEHERYEWAGLPYCHCLNFVNNADWGDGKAWYSDFVPPFPDVFSPYFEEYCNWVALYYCSQMAEDPNLIGYFYTDVPDWSGDLHSDSWTRDLDLSTEYGQKSLEAIARRYYQVTHDAIRRHDRNHLILGDRYHGGHNTPDVVFKAMVPTVDVLSIQYGHDFKREKPKYDRWYGITGKPIILADIVMPAEDLTPPTQERRGEVYKEYLTDALSEEYVVGLHFCGAYVENKARTWGVKDRMDEPYQGIVNAFKEIHPQAYQLAAQNR